MNTSALNGLEFRSVKLGRCRAGRPPGAAARPGIQDMQSASDEDLQIWIVNNEARFEERSKQCAEDVLTAHRVRNPAEWRANRSSPSPKYMLFEWSGHQMRESGEKQPHSHFYLRGKLQRASFPHERFHNNRILEALFQIVEIRNVWLIASNRRLNFSAVWYAEDKANPSASGGSGSCNEGKLIH